MINEPHLPEEVVREWYRCAAEGAPLAVLVAALDHQADPAGRGDGHHLEHALRVHCARERDRVIRQDRDHFIAVLPQTAPPGAQHIGQQIVEAMHHTPEPGETVTVGVAGTAPSESDDPATLLHRAQRALHSGQQKGGNRCLGASPPHPPPKSALTQLSELLQTPKKAEARKRSTD